VLDAGYVTQNSEARHRRGAATAAATPPAEPRFADRGTPGDRTVDLRNADSEGWVWGDEQARAPMDAPLSALVSMAIRLLGAFWWCTAQGTGISPAGLGVVRLLAARDGLKSSEVAARGWSTPGTVTSVVDTLVRDGYVERRRDPGDRRVVRLYLTEQGRQKVAESVSLIGPKWNGAFDYVDPADEAVIRKFLVDTIEHFSKLVREERGK
jgi:DNA-binding MarR family transcriptional regulator